MGGNGKKATTSENWRGGPGNKQKLKRGVKQGGEVYMRAGKIRKGDSQVCSCQWKSQINRSCILKRNQQSLHTQFCLCLFGVFLFVILFSNSKPSPTPSGFLSCLSSSCPVGGFFVIGARSLSGTIQPFFTFFNKLLC